jgi:hypothetical protein
MKSEAKTRKVFTGKLLGPFEDLFDRNFNKAALRAYLKGWDYFQFGRDNSGKPKMFFVPKDRIKIK